MFQQYLALHFRTHLITDAPQIDFLTTILFMEIFLFPLFNLVSSDIYCINEQKIYK